MTAILQYTVCATTTAPCARRCSSSARRTTASSSATTRASLTLLAGRRIHDGRCWPYSKIADAFDKSGIDTGVRSARLHLVDSAAVNTRTGGDEA